MKSVSMYLFGSWAWLVFTVILLIMVCCFPFTRTVESARTLGKRSASAMLKLMGIELNVEGSEHLVNGPSILVANHASYTDPMIMAAALPPKFGYVAKKELKHIPFANYVLGKLGTNLVDRVNPKKGTDDLNKIMKSNKAQDSIVFFPEATFLKEKGLLKFKKGAFITAIRNKSPVIPVTINGSRELLRSESWLPKKVSLHIKIHPPLNTSNEFTNPQELSDESRKMILGDLNEPDLNHRSFS